MFLLIYKVFFHLLTEWAKLLSKMRNQLQFRKFDHSYIAKKLIRDPSVCVSVRLLIVIAVTGERSRWRKPPRHDGTTYTTLLLTYKTRKQEPYGGCSSKSKFQRSKD